MTKGYVICEQASVAEFFLTGFDARIPDLNGSSNIAFSCLVGSRVTWPGNPCAQHPNAGNLSPHLRTIMTSNRNLISTESRELETSGTHFDDGSVIQGLTDVTLSRIVIWHGEYINALTVGVPTTPTGDRN